MTVSNNLSLMLAKLPDKLRGQLKSCPAEGNGVHAWLFRMALGLYGRFTEDEIVETLKAHLSCCRLEREIIDAVENSGRVVRGEMPLTRGQVSIIKWSIRSWSILPLGSRILEPFHQCTLEPEDRGPKIFSISFSQVIPFCVLEGVRAFFGRGRVSFGEERNRECSL
jgi:hypothetical protein